MKISADEKIRWVYSMIIQKETKWRGWKQIKYNKFNSLQDLIWKKGEI